MTRLIYIPFDHLNENYGALKDCDPAKDVIVFVESQGLLAGAKWHRQRLFFLISSARHFSQELRQKGYQVHYVKAQNTLDGILEVKKKINAKQVLTAEPSSHKLFSELADHVEYVQNDFFLTSRNIFKAWANSQKKLLMENFYQFQRKRLNILIDKAGKPIGGKWNYDAENRKNIPAGYIFPPYLTHERDEIDLAVIKELEESKLELWGNSPDLTWATTRAGALRQLKYFIDNHLENFGTYEDAMTDENWALHHSLLSPYLNNGLLHASEVIDAVLKAHVKKKFPLASLEGFIRQVIGWREFINGVYWFFEAEHRDSNFWKGKRKLPAFFEDPDATEMNCLKNVVGDIKERAWAHHIPRLMILSNYAFLTGISPQEFLAWMRRVFVDAADWVMVPNVIGMSLNADGGKMTSKPYFAGGSYISKMSNYCKGCAFDPKTRSEENSCPFTSLYWNFVDENFDQLATNHRLVKQIHGIKRLKDLPETLTRAKSLLKDKNY